MKLSEYIKGLQKFLKENGDMECYYAKDDEGNAYQEVHYTGSKFIITDSQKDEYYPDLIDTNDTERVEDLKRDSDDFSFVCVIN